MNEIITNTSLFNMENKEKPIEEDSEMLLLWKVNE